MRTGNYMTADRMLTLANAAATIVDYYTKLEYELQMYRSNCADGQVSLDTIQEMLNRNRPPLSALTTVLGEKRYFETHKIRNERNKDAHRFRRESEYDYRSGDTTDWLQSSTPAPSGTPVSELEGSYYSDSRSPQNLYDTLVETTGSSKFIAQVEIEQILNVDKSSIDALVRCDLLKEASPVGSGRYYIP